jgi:hypothetical protein
MSEDSFSRAEQRNPVSWFLLSTAMLFLGLASSLFLQEGCPRGSAPPPPPTITLNAIDCPKDQVQINPTVTKTGGGGRKWALHVSVAVKCNGRPIKAEFLVKVDDWWTQKYITNDNGELTVNGPPQDGDPGGQSVNVTVNGNDGEKQETLTVP